MRNRKNVSIGGLLAVFIEAHTNELAALQLQATHRRAQNYFPAPPLDFGLATFVEIGKRNRRHTHAIAGGAGKESLPENIDAKARVGAIQLFVERADQDDAPEAIDSASGLAAAVRPFQHGDTAFSLKIRRIAFVLADHEQRARI